MTFTKTLSSLKDKVSRNEKEAPTSSNPRTSSYMNEEASSFDENYRAPNKSQKFTSTLTRGLTSAKYATVRSAKGIKIGLQEGTDKVSGAISNTASKLKKTKSTDGNSSAMRAVPVV